MLSFLLFTIKISNASQVQTVPFTKCRHTGYFRMAGAQSIEQQRCPKTSLGPSVVCSPLPKIECL